MAASRARREGAERRRRARGAEARRRRGVPVPARGASERFAAGYIRCLHEVHSFVCSCPGIGAAAAAALLGHLLRAMPRAPDPATGHEPRAGVQADTEQSPTDGQDASRTRSSPSPRSPKSVWRPW
ncbi:transcription cofactor HES-6-like [Cuculus canorus]|uniref:transcription cofactor HES-6-like n=1 Tax=Cuculus canorus TaxID=55661 RepID=UPI0023AAE5D7|nr:transcription cofactor HES-6-like [Cuculus canorus]